MFCCRRLRCCGCHSCDSQLPVGQSDEAQKANIVCGQVQPHTPKVMLHDSKFSGAVIVGCLSKNDVKQACRVAVVWALQGSSGVSPL